VGAGGALGAGGAGGALFELLGVSLLGGVIATEGGSTGGLAALVAVIASRKWSGADVHVAHRRR
jgi:hypothetical protein